MNRVRVRFAPSPTGALHIGGVRTALFNYLFAKKQGGDFLLRIEDTDQARYKEGAEPYIVDAMAWCGMPFDEGPHEGGDYAPYRQSERGDIYHQYIRQLLDGGYAYYAFDTPEELDSARKEAEGNKASFTYNYKVRGEFRNALSMSADEVKKRVESGVPYVVRFKTPENRRVHVHDLIRGDIQFHTAEMDDKVLFKSDGLPTYHFANVVDDCLMKISHVIRGEEWLPSLPLHVLLYEAFGWDVPQFAHLPLILKPTGKGKLSKRDGDKMGFPVFPLLWKDPVTSEEARGYKEDGYLPAAFINMLAMLGWNPGTEQEIFSMEELIAHFTLDKVNKSASRFDPDKAKWFNHQYIMALPNEELAKMVQPQLDTWGISPLLSDIALVVGMVKDRMDVLPDFLAQADYFFSAPTQFNEGATKKKWQEGVGSILQRLIPVIQGVAVFQSLPIEDAVKEWITQEGYKPGTVLNALRIAIVGDSRGVHLFDIVSFIGKDDTIQRIKRAVEVLGE